MCSSDLVTCLRVGSSRMLHLPGELFVEYQLAAKAMRPDLQVAVAAYGDYGPGYVGSTCSYDQGGYEVGPTSSNVAPQVEPVLLEAMKSLLEAKDAPAALPPPPIPLAPKAQPATKAPAAPKAPPANKPTPASDAGAVQFESFELKDAKLIDVLRVIRAKAYMQGQLIDITLDDRPDGSLGDQMVTVSLKSTTVGQVLQLLSRTAGFRYVIKGHEVTISPK